MFSSSGPRAASLASSRRACQVRSQGEGAVTSCVLKASGGRSGLIKLDKCINTSCTTPLEAVGDALSVLFRLPDSQTCVGSLMQI